MGGFGERSGEVTGPHGVRDLDHPEQDARQRLQVLPPQLGLHFGDQALPNRPEAQNFLSPFIHDGIRGGASLEIDIAQGGIATVIGNVIGQGSETQNPVLLSYGSEEGGWDVNRLHLSHNTFINHGWMPAWFPRVHRANLPPGTELVAVNNLLVGGGVFEWVNEGHFEGSQHVRRGQLSDVDTNAVELPPASGLRGSGVDPRRVRKLDLAPRAEFEWSLGRKELDPPAERRTSWSPGAFQK